MTNTNELSNLPVITILAVIFFLMFIIYKTVTISQKRKVVKFENNRKVYRKRKSHKVKVTHDTSVFNYTNDNKDDFIQSCWDELNKKGH